MSYENKKNRLKEKNGFTLIEVIVAMGMFALIMAAVAGVFASAVSGYRAGREMQRNLEAAQMAVNVMAKSLRTSSVVSGDGNRKSIRFLSYSEGGSSTRRCVEYELSSGVLRLRDTFVSDGSNAKTDCSDSSSFSSWKTLATVDDTGSFFNVYKSVQVGDLGESMGRVTVTLNIPSASGGQDVRMQSSVSLRDYENVGL
jgi:prepilin-type N-terminal cleavage/methylation domain-containing protein